MADGRKAFKAAEVHRKRGARFLQKASFKEAIPELETALSLKPEDPELIHELAYAHFLLAQKKGSFSQFDLAEEYCHRAAALVSQRRELFALLDQISAERDKLILKKRRRRKGILLATLAVAGLFAAFIGIIAIGILTAPQESEAPANPTSPEANPQAQPAEAP